MFVKAPLALLGAALCLAAAGCGDHGGSASPATGANAPAPRKAQQSGLDRDLVKAASPNTSGADIEMRFKLASHPQAGGTAPLTLVFVPPPDEIERMTVSLQSSEGLSIESGEGPAIFVPSHGAPITHEMSVKADHDGIYFLTASVLLENPNNTSSSRSFSVPVIVGAGISPTSQGAEGAGTDEKPQAVKTLPAKSRKAQ